MDAILDILLLLADDIGLNKNDLLDVWPLLSGVGGVIVPRQIFTWMHKKEGLVADEWEEGSYKTTPCCLYECRSDPQKKKRGSRQTNGRKDALCLLLVVAYD